MCSYGKDFCPRQGSKRESRRVLLGNTHLAWAARKRLSMRKDPAEMSVLCQPKTCA